MSIKKFITENKEVPELGKLRDEIDRIDKELIELLSERTNVVKEISEIKRKYKAPVLQKNRWQQVVDKIRGYASSKGINADDVEDIWNAIHKQSINAQKENIS